LAIGEGEGGKGEGKKEGREGDEKGKRREEGGWPLCPREKKLIN